MCWVWQASIHLLFLKALENYFFLIECSLRPVNMGSVLLHLRGGQVTQSKSV